MLVFICLTVPTILDCQSNSAGEWVNGLLDGYGISGWVIAYLVYIWSIICGKMYPEEDFNEMENYFKEFELH